jgi:DNA-binding NarL/FixJ family response regulator
VTANEDSAGTASRAIAVGGGLGPEAIASSAGAGPTPKIRVLLADDHPVVRAGLRGMLATEPDIEVVAEAGSGPEAVALAARTELDVILMDLRMPGGDGVTATAAIQSRAQAAGGSLRTPSTPAVSAVAPASGHAPRVLILTTYDTDADILRAVEAGAAGYLLKDATKHELAEAIRAAARGETVLAPAVAGRLVTHLRRPQEPEPAALSAREAEVLARAARGMTNAEIGRALFISEATVKTHLLRACTKLGVSGRTAAVAAAAERGLLKPPAS